MPWLLNVTYLLLLLLVSPVVLYRRLVQGKYREGWAQKLAGLLPERTGEKPCLWLHAVSVGEVLQLQTIIEQFALQRPDVELVISTTTQTGYAVARDKFPQYTVCYFPLDFSWAVRRAFRRIKPAAVVLVELELWPNFILEAKRTGTPLALINGRISEKSFRGYRRIRPLMRQLLGSFDVLAVQNETYAERLVELGAPAERVRVTGSIKFDRVSTDRNNAQTQELRRAFGIGEGERVFVTGSTHPPEEEYALDAWLQLRDNYPDLRLVLVPRHQERFDEAARLVESRGLPLLRRSLSRESTVRSQESGVRGQRSEIRQPTPAGRAPRETTDHGQRTTDQSAIRNPQSAIRPVLLLDTLGELSACWGLADIAFVGGSLTSRGGQNMIEPAAYGAAVLFGPNTRNFRDVVEILLGQNAARVVKDREDLTRAVRHLLERPAAAREQGRTAQRLVLAQQGATARTLEAIAPLLPLGTVQPQQHGLPRVA